MTKISGILASCAVALGMTVAATSAQASSLPGVTDSYVGTFNVADGYNGTHGLWFDNLFMGSGLSDPKEWQSTGGQLSYDGTNITLTGSVKSNKNGGTNNLLLNYSFNLIQIPDGGRDPACQGGRDCQLVVNGGVATQLQYDNVLFFDYVSASVTGAGDLTGLELDLSIKPSNLDKPFQFGYCANWFDCNFGGSSWFTYTVASQADVYDSQDSTTSKYKAIGGHGDINISLTPVPLPAAGWLLIAGIGALGAARARRKRA